MKNNGRRLMSGNEAVALAALHAGVALGTGYPGTPSTEILEEFSAIGGRAQWAPNEKVALEVGIGAAFGGARALVTMKHVGLNVAADPFFTVTYTGVSGALIVVSADDPGMASSQNEQDNRHYAKAAAAPMIEPADSQEAYDFFLAAIELSERWRIPVLFRMTTRVCHSQTAVRPRSEPLAAPEPSFVRDVPGRVMIPAFARPAHRRLRAKLAEIQQWNEESPLNREISQGARLGIITSGVSYHHAREAAPGADFLKLGLTWPLPVERIRRFVGAHEMVRVIEEGDPWLVDALRAEGMTVLGKPEMYRFGELTVERVRRILANDESPEPAPPRGKPPELCQGCPHRTAFNALHELDCIVTGDIGCYTLGVLPPFSAMDTCVCMGASLGAGLGLRHVLPPEQARRVVSVIGDSTFVHSGITGVVEMVYNKPEPGHVLLILDNGTTAMTGLQEHPGTGRALDHSRAGKLDFEALLRAIGVAHVHTLDAVAEPEEFGRLLREALDRNDLTVIIARRPCILAAGKIRSYEQALAAARGAAGCCAPAEPAAEA